MNNLPKVVTQLLPRVGFEPVARKSNALPVAPPTHKVLYTNQTKKLAPTHAADMMARQRGMTGAH